MAYDLNAEGSNGVNDTTLVGALSDFNVPTPPPDSDGYPQSKALWVTDASALNASWPGTGPVDGTWSRAGNGGASGVIGWGSLDGTGVGVSGQGGGTGGGGTGVLGSGRNGVFGATNDATGIGVIGQNTGGTGVVGWAVSPAGQGSGSDFEPAPGISPLTLPAGEVVGVYGCISNDLRPSRSNVQSGVWGDARNSHGTATGSGVIGTSQAGPGLSGSSESGSGVTASSNSGPGVSASSKSGPGVTGSSSNDIGGVFQSDSDAGISAISTKNVGGIFQSDKAAQLRLVPSSIPLTDSPLMQTGQVGDLYLYSQEHEVGTTGTYHYSTMLWLCIAPTVPGGQAMWAQVQLGDLTGG